MVACAFTGPLATQPACAQSGAHVGLVVEFSPNDQRAFCAPVTATDATSGIELLRAAGFPLTTRVYNGMGEFVCSVATTGTGIRDCPARDNSFWGYYVLRGSRWEVSDLGASTRIVHGGDVQAWVWQPRGRAIMPTARSIDDVCGNPAAHTISLASRAPARRGTTKLWLVLLGVVVVLAATWRMTTRLDRRIRSERG